MQNPQKPTGVHLVGSIPLSSTGEVFTTISSSLPGRLQTIPDGEPGDRNYFVRWQKAVFPEAILRPHLREDQSATQGGKQLVGVDIQPTRYDEYAIQSYQLFRQLRSSGALPSRIRFQVCIPTPLNVINSRVDPLYQAQAEPLYEERILEALREIQKDIPCTDLAIQFDCAQDMAYLEYNRGRLTESMFKPYFSPVKEGILERISRITAVVDPRVSLGFHLCYGDSEHRHFIEPADTSLLVEMATGIIQTVQQHHSIDWIHMPVPRDRTDTAYFAPLRNLRLPDSTKLYLGLVHAKDESGTLQRVHAAQASCDVDFGVATECGMGRTPPEELESILQISRAVTLGHS